MIEKLGFDRKDLKHPHYYEKIVDEFIKNNTKKNSILSFNLPNKSNDKVPLVIIPSFLGTTLKAKLTDVEGLKWNCRKNSNWFTLYLDYKQFLPLQINCFMHHIKLYFDKVKKNFFNSQGVEIQTECSTGELECIEYVDDFNTYGLWNSMIKILVKFGYEKGKNIVSIPYDWRRAPNDIMIIKTYENLKNLIEDTYKKNGNQKVLLTSLSMGGLYGQVFLNHHVTKEWKKKFVKGFVALCPPLTGTNVAMNLLLGLNVHKIPYIDYVLDWKEVREVVKNIPSVFFMLPNHYGYGKDKLLVSTQKRNYTTNDISVLLKDAGYEEGSALYDSFRKEREIKAPEVEYTLVHSTGTQTQSNIHFFGNFDSDHSVSYEDGDDTVLTEPLIRIVESWKNQQEEKIEIYNIPNVKHASLVHDKGFFAILTKKLELL